MIFLLKNHYYREGGPPKVDPEPRTHRTVPEWEELEARIEAGKE